VIETPTEICADERDGEPITARANRRKASDRAIRIVNLRLKVNPLEPPISARAEPAAGYQAKAAKSRPSLIRIKPNCPIPIAAFALVKRSDAQ
jgi:hypothetical protein